jgi:uncharacterized protein (DUF849 family)
MLMVIQLAVNGSRSRAEHPAVPLTPAEIAADATAAHRVGVRAVHVHPRDANGEQTLDAAVVIEVLSRIRESSSIAVGFTTQQGIVPDLGSRLELIRAWPRVDFASVNVSEAGWRQVAEVLLQAGSGIEAGVWSEADADALADSGLAHSVSRVLVEPIETSSRDALARIAAIHERLDRLGISAPRLQHTEDESGWAVIEDALRHGHQTRVGLEDELTLPDGSVPADNAALVAAAVALRPDQESRVQPRSDAR